MLTTFRNAFKIPELRKKIFFTLFIIIIFRLGMALRVPFVNPAVMAALVEQGSGDILSFVDYMTGGGFSSAALFGLGVQPYINASIIMQLLTIAIPSLQRIQQEGPDGQRRYQKIVRLAGGGLAVVMGFLYYTVLRNQYIPGIGYGLYYGAEATLFSQIFSGIVIILSFVAGSMLVMWMGEQIDQNGIGNGISMIIFAGIVSRVGSLWSELKAYLELAKAGQSQIYIFLPIILVLAIAAVVLVIILNEAERRIPVQYAKKVVGRKMYGGQSTHLPIKVNISGVMPIIFASSLTTIPGTILRFFSPDASSFLGKTLHAFSSQGWMYAMIYGILIVAFNFFYVSVTYNPIERANQLKKSNGAIPGIRPGKPTSDFIARVVSKITFIGSLFLVVVAVGPIILGNATGINIQLGGTSLLIVVGVALDTARSLESFMLMRHHKGFLE